MLPTRAFKLANGLKVVVQTDPSSPLVAVALTYHVGSMDEERGRAGFAHLFEHLMFQGTVNLPPNAISRLVESNGGVDNAYTMKTNTTYHEVVPSGALEAALWAEADRMRGLLISERELEIEKRVVLEEMAQTYDNQPYRRATDAAMGALAFSRWETSHPTIGDADDLRAATLADVRRFYDRHYAPDNAALALVGDVTVAEARRLVARHFGPVPRRTRPPRPRGTEPPRAAERRARVEDALATNPLLVLGWRLPRRGSADYWALSALSAALGGGEDSPLHAELVKSSRLALSASAHMPYWSSHSSARGADLFGVFATLRADADLDAAAAAALRVIERFRREGPSAEELARAKVQLERSWLEGQTSLADRAQTLSSYTALVGEPSGLRRDFARLLKTRREDVRRAAKRWLGERGRCRLEVVPGPARPSAPPPTPAEPPFEEPRAAGAPPPPLGPERPLRPPQVERFTLACGLDVLVARDARLPLVEARLGLRAGRAHEADGEDALSPACEELLFKGDAGRDAAAVARALSALGWSAGAASETEWFKVAASGLARTFDAFCAELARALTEASFPDDEVELWRENAVEELALRRSQPSFLAEERLRAELFSGHPYRRGAPDEAALAAVAAPRLRAYRAARVRPSGGYLVLAGDLEPEQARKSLERAFSGWTGTTPPPAPPPLPGRAAAKTALVGRAGSAQATLVVAQAGPLTPRDADYVAFATANHVLGGTANSRLFENLRTRRGYTYGAYSSIEVYGRGSVWSASADVRPDAARAALDEILAEARALREQPLPDAALAAAKRHLTGLFRMRLSSLDRVAGYLAAIVESGRDPVTAIASYPERLAAVTPDSALAAARARLDPDRLVAVVVGDEAALRGPLGL
ncbi:MAG: insulinase family protein [Elusimicrobia bacterium]|nr:insulinase family protein [Elusimicrobiota bacterium]